MFKNTPASVYGLLLLQDVLKALSVHRSHFDASSRHGTTQNIEIECISEPHHVAMQ